MFIVRLLLILLFLPVHVLAQDRPLQHSEHGWSLSPKGTIRILLIFAEIEYDQNRGNDPQPGGAEHWRQGQLPTWKDDVFDPHPLDVPQAMVSRYYHDISLGQYVVLGDYIDRLITIRESEHANVRQAHGLSKVAVTEANKMPELRTRHGLKAEDFDMWKRGGKPGQPKEPGPDSPHSYDHIMVILRNSSLTHGQGSVDAGSPGPLFGFQADSQSRFGGMNALPFEILKHEFNHLLLGGNNFHSGGGNAAQFPSYFLNLQGGWSMMGAASSSLLTCSAWDRQRLNWTAEGAEHLVNARDGNGRAVNGDIDPLQGDTGIYVLRDMITSGDALRIRIPFIPEDRYQQWLWIENHQGYPRNGSPTDKFHWEDGRCVEHIRPGLFMVMQVDRDDRVGPNIYGGHADYLRPMPATGMYDFELRGDTLQNTCPFGNPSLPYVLRENTMNPFTGNHEQELIMFDRNKDGLVHGGEHYVPGMRVRRGREEGPMVFYGRWDHAFQMDGNRRVGMDTNPSSANMMTLVSGNKKDLYGQNAPNVRTIYPNGISVEMLDMNAAGDIMIRVRANDTRLSQDLRWCADSIVLNPLRGQGGHSLSLAARRTLTLDRSLTPTRMDQADTVGSTIYFSSPTRFLVSENASMLLAPRSSIDLRNGSEMHLMPNSTVKLERRARLRIDRASSIVLVGNARIVGEERRVARLERQGRIVRRSATDQ